MSGNKMQRSHNRHRVADCAGAGVDVGIGVDSTSRLLRKSANHLVSCAIISPLLLPKRVSRSPFSIPWEGGLQNNFVVRYATGKNAV